MSGLGKAIERFAGAEAAGLKFNGCDLNELVIVVAEAGGFEVVNDEGLTGIELICPNKGMIASGASHTLANVRFTTAEILVTAWAGALDFHS